MDSKIKSDFAILCRALRVERGLKQREVAALIGVKPATYGNVESSQYKVINRRRAVKLVEAYDLPTQRATELLAAWDRCPLSPFGEKRKHYWEKRNLLRSKAKNHDPLKFALAECVGIILMDRPDDLVCECADGALCTVCYSLHRLGATSPFNQADRDKILAQLAKIRADLMPARQAEAAPPDPPPDEIFGA